MVNIKKRKEEYIKFDNEEHINQNRKRKFKHTPYEEVNKLCWTWFNKSRSMNIPLSGPIIQETARKFAAELQLPSFKGSNGWLDSFTKAHNINLKVISGDETSRESDAGITFLNNLRNICKDYNQRDIFNVDEMSLCWRAQPERTWLETQKHTKADKVVREKIVVMLAVSGEGEKLKPLVLGRICKPQCVKYIDLEKFGVSYKSNKTTWMTSNIFREWLQSTNDTFFKENRKVLFFLHSTPSHPFIALSNITLCFLPNSPSFLQPLDHGIIRTLKANYRKSLMKHLIVSLDMRTNSRVSLFDMLMWLKKAWEDVSTTTIQNSFFNAGFKLNNDSLIVVEADCDAELNELINQSHALYLIKDKISAEEFHKFDDELQYIEVGQQVDLFNVVLQENTPVMEAVMDQDDDPTVEPCIDYQIAMLHVKELKQFTVQNDVNFIDEILNIEKKLHDAIVGSQRFALNEFFY